MTRLILTDLYAFLRHNKARGPLETHVSKVYFQIFSTIGSELEINHYSNLKLIQLPRHEIHLKAAVFLNVNASKPENRRLVHKLSESFGSCNCMIYFSVPMHSCWTLASAIMSLRRGIIELSRFVQKMT